MKNIIAILIMFFALVQVKAQTNIKVGQKAPEINITNWIENIPSDKNFSGKFIVLEFWATWCGPCLAAVPHMNELQEEFSREDLYFISITDESIAKVERKLKRIPFQSIVVADETKATQIAYGDGEKGLAALPMTVLISDEGIIKWIGNPMQLSSEVMKKFLSDELEQQQKIAEVEQDENAFLELIKDKEIKYFFHMGNADEKSKGNMSIMEANKSIYQTEGITLFEIYQDILDVEASRVEIPSGFEKQRFNFSYKNLKNVEDALAELEKEILDFLKLKKETEIKEVPIFEVKIEHEEMLEETLEKEFSSKSDAGLNINFTAYTLEAMLNDMSKELGQKFEFKGENEKKYDFYFTRTSKKAFIADLKSYGFSVTPKTTEMEFIKLVKE